MKFDDFFHGIRSTPLAPYEEAFRTALEAAYGKRNHGDEPRWAAVIDRLPDLEDCQRVMDESRVGIRAPDNLKLDTIEIRETLMGLHPWRKGPFQVLGVDIDCEWRSDWKWQRVLPHVSPLKGRTVLDVGCGSGYHCWRMHGAGADFVLGIDPSLLFMYQFAVIKKYCRDAPVHYLPLKSEQLPSPMPVFDTVFSMGILYHRKEPKAHLQELGRLLKPGGELVLETLVLDREDDAVLYPRERYAQMRNVYAVPSVSVVRQWLEETGFSDVRVVDINQTTLEEQRSTEWMRFQSLPDFLDKQNDQLTVEGYPRPVRACLVCNFRE